MENKTILRKGIISLVISLFLFNLASAAGVVAPYSDGNPLQMNYGETKIVNFNFQNMVGNEDIKIEVKIKEGSDIATLQQSVFTIPAKTSDAIIPVTISIPENYPINPQKIELEIKTISEAAGQGIVSVGAGWITGFNVLINSESSTEATSDKGSAGVALIVVLVLVIVLVIFLLIRKRATNNF